MADESNPRTGPSTFKAFTPGIRDRCEAFPATMELNPVGAYRFLAD